MLLYSVQLNQYNGQDWRRNLLLNYLNMDVGKEEIVPLSLLVHPTCVVPNFGLENKNEYMMVQPKGQWSEYFARFVQNGNNSL